MSRLNSWKEIAGYFGRDVRTVQKWEDERDLPIHRPPGDRRGMVTAETEELDAWWKSSFKATEGINSASIPSSKETNRSAPSGDPIDRYRQSSLITRRGAISLLAAGCLAATVQWPRSSKSYRKPVSYRVDGKVLAVFDEEGHVLWRHFFEKPLHSESYGPATKKAWIGDLNSDGNTQIVFIADVSQEQAEQCIVHCFDATGKELWRMQPGKKIRTGTEEFTAEYNASQLTVLSTREGSKKIVISSHHVTHYPNQVLLLDTHGKAQGEYWHSGHLLLMKVADLNEDGRPEIYLGGVNNECQAATLVVLDPENVNGASRQNSPKYQFEASNLDKELGRVVMPRSCINLRTEQYNTVGSFRIDEQGITIGTRELLIDKSPLILYVLNANLQMRNVSASDTFMAYHKQYEIEGRLKHRFSDAELVKNPLLRLV